MSSPKSWVAGWKALEKRERDELRKESSEEKFKALTFLMASADLFDFSQFETEDAIARARWVRLQSLMAKR